MREKMVLVPNLVPSHQLQLNLPSLIGLKFTVHSLGGPKIKHVIEKPREVPTMLPPALLPHNPYVFAYAHK